MVALLCARQCGNTTLASQLVPVASANSFDLEDPISQGTVVIDEVQHRPELFPILRLLADRADALALDALLTLSSPVALDDKPVGASAHRR